MNNEDTYFMNMAYAARSASKCPKATYGAIIVGNDNRIVSTGFNGKPAHSLNDHICLRPSHLPLEEQHFCCLHAECNAIMAAERWRLRGSTMYVTGPPCEACALLIMQAGIRRLVYIDCNHDITGHNSGASDDFWKSFGHAIERIPITPSTFIEALQVLQHRGTKQYEQTLQIQAPPQEIPSHNPDPTT